MLVPEYFMFYILYLMLTGAADLLKFASLSSEESETNSFYFQDKTQVNFIFPLQVSGFQYSLFSYIFILWKHLTLLSKVYQYLREVLEATSSLENHLCAFTQGTNKTNKYFLYLQQCWKRIMIVYNIHFIV